MTRLAVHKTQNDSSMKQVDPFGAVRNGNNRIKRSQPIGTITIRKRKQASRTRTHWSRFIKVQLSGGPGDRWKLFARWWWEKNRGPVPSGQVVYHKDGDEMNDAPENLAVGTFGEKFVAAHARDPEMSRRNHEEIGRIRAEMNRQQGRINRTKNFIKGYWYPVVDEMSVILNVPFRRRKRLLGCFGVDVSLYPANGVGKHVGSEVQRALAAADVSAIKSHDLRQPEYRTYCLFDPESRSCRGPMSGSTSQMIAQLDRMGVWKYAEKQAQRDLEERK